MEDDPARYRHVFHPTGEFFERHALLYADLAALERFVDRLATVQPYLAALAADGSLASLAKMMARGVRAASDGEVPGSELARMMERAAAIEARDTAGPPRVRAEIVPAAASTRQRHRRPVLDLAKVPPPPSPSVVRTARELGLDRACPCVTGIWRSPQALHPANRAREPASFLSSPAHMVPVSLESTTIVALANMVVGLCAMTSTVAIGHLNTVSVAFAVLFIGLSDDYGIHFCMRYRELLKLGHAHDDALDETARDAGTSIAICALDDRLHAFVPTEFRGVPSSNIASANVFIKYRSLRLPQPWFARRGAQAGGTISPAQPPGSRSAPAGEAATAFRYGIAAWSPRRRSSHDGCGMLVPRPASDGNPLNVRDQAESVRAFATCCATASRTRGTSVVADARRRRAATRRALYPTVRSATTIPDFVPDRQREARASCGRGVLLSVATRHRLSGPTIEQQLMALRFCTTR
jgi:hypothetical protein